MELIDLTIKLDLVVSTQQLEALAENAYALAIEAIFFAIYFTKNYKYCNILKFSAVRPGYKSFEYNAGICY